ncbi:hypothetical protein ACH42_01810 [Endozoicomonas sp. (ex Bugula neritina AB1)]|nr:hypothetical protein ACH42_01810 [Endozoicomonas sp. (ex Bugula neritina AB1)]
MKTFLSAMVFALIAVVSIPVSANVGLMGLVTSQLGVSDKQANDGIAALLATAQPNLDKPSMNSLSGIIPNMSGLLSTGNALLSSSKNSGTSGMLGQVMGGSESSLLGLNSIFEKLGLNSGMVGQFTKILLNYVSSQGSQGLMQKLQSTLL